jgi:hypothetical protein
MFHSSSEHKSLHTAGCSLVYIQSKVHYHSLHPSQYICFRENLLALCSRNEWKTGKSWFQKSHKIIIYSTGWIYESTTDYIINNRIIRYLNDVKLISTVSLEEDHWLLVANFGIKTEPILEQWEENWSMKVKDTDIKENFTTMIKNKALDEVKSV